MKLPERISLRLWLEAAAHVDFRAAALEEHFVHQMIDEIYSTTVSVIQVLAFGWIGEPLGIESGAWIADHDQHAVVVFKNHRTLHVLGRVARASVFDGVGKGLAQCGLDCQFFLDGLSADSRHYGLNQRRYCGKSCWDGDFHFERKVGRCVPA